LGVSQCLPPIHRKVVRNRFGARLLTFLKIQGDLLQLLPEALFPDVNLIDHTLEDPCQIAEGVWPLGNELQSGGIVDVSFTISGGNRETLNLSQILDLPIAVSLPFEARPNPRLKQHGIEGFGQIIVGAQLVTVQT